MMIPSVAVAQVSAVAAKALAKKSGYLKRHSLVQKKDAPSYREVAAPYKGRPGAEQKLAVFISTGPKVKVDGEEEEHDALKTKSDVQIKNVAAWIQSQ